MERTFLCGHQPRAHGHTRCTQSQCRCQSPAVGKASCADHRNCQIFRQMWNQHQRGNIFTVCRRFLPGGDNRGHAKSSARLACPLTTVAKTFPPYLYASLTIQSPLPRAKLMTVLFCKRTLAFSAAPGSIKTRWRRRLIGKRANFTNGLACLSGFKDLAVQSAGIGYGRAIWAHLSSSYRAQSVICTTFQLILFS